VTSKPRFGTSKVGNYLDQCTFCANPKKHFDGKKRARLRRGFFGSVSMWVFANTTPGNPLPRRWLVWDFLFSHGNLVFPNKRP